MTPALWGSRRSASRFIISNIPFSLVCALVLVVVVVVGGGEEVYSSHRWCT